MSNDKSTPAPKPDPDETEPEENQDESRPSAETWESVKRTQASTYNPEHWPKR